MKNFETERLIIRKFRMEDVEDAFQNWAKDEQIADCNNYRPHKSTQETKMFVVSAMNDSETGTPIWALEEKESHSVIGMVKTEDISLKNKRCNLIFLMGY